MTADDILTRLKALIPPSWFPSVSPVLDGLLSGAATVLAHIHDYLGYVKLQTRLATASDGYLDLLAYDYLGLRFLRRADESDTSFRARVKAEILRERVTRAGLVTALENLTGRPPFFICEPYNPRDCGGYRAMGGYSMAGRYGSRLLPGQLFIEVYLPPSSGIPNVNGYQGTIGGWGVGRMRWSDLSEVSGPVTPADIYAAINATKAAGVLAWVGISPFPTEATLDGTFTLDQNTAL